MTAPEDRSVRASILSRAQRPTPYRVVVLGAGYAGLIAVNRFLGSLTTDERRQTGLTVVNPRPDFVERIRLHQLAAGSRTSVTRPLSDLLHPAARVLPGAATMIDPHAQQVQVATGHDDVMLPYDVLVYAVGSRSAARVPGARQHAHLLGDFEGACSAAAALVAAGSGVEIAVVGGGFTAVEAASELAEQHPDARVTMYCSGALVGAMRPSARRRIAKALRRLGVRVVEDASVVEVEAQALRMASGARHRFDVCLMATSFDVPDLAAASGLPVDATGRLIVDETLRCPADFRILGAGDAVAPPSSVAAHLRMGCASALPLGGHAANTLLATIRGREAALFSMGYAIQCLSLGRHDGYIQVVRADDTPRNVYVTGRAGARVKELISTMVVERPREERVKPGSYAWPRGPRTPGRAIIRATAAQASPERAR